MQFIIICLLGMGVLITYYFTFSGMGGYINHPYWFGIPTNIQKLLIVFQVFAVIGFLTSFLSWYKNPPKGGLMGKGSVLFITLVIFMISAIVWPLAVKNNWKLITVISLVITAICSILLLAGSIEENEVRIYVILGWILLSIVTVLSDGVLWNANYIKGWKRK